MHLAVSEMAEYRDSNNYINPFVLILWSDAVTNVAHRLSLLHKTDIKHKIDRHRLNMTLWCCHLLQLARYVPNVAKRSIWEQCKKKYILRTDRPTNLTFWENFKWPYLREGSSDPLHDWFYFGVFGVGGSNGAISGFAKSNMAARPPSWKIQMAIYPRRILLKRI